MVMEHEELAKSHGIWESVMEFNQICPRIVPNLHLFLPSLTNSHGKLRNGQGEKSGENVLSVCWNPDRYFDPLSL